MSCCWSRLCPLHPHASPPSACLDSARLKVTHVESFWTAVEQTVAAGHLVTTDSHQPVEGALSKTVIILPRIVTRLHPVYQEPEQHIYRWICTNEDMFSVKSCRVSRTKQVRFDCFNGTLLCLQGLGSLGCGLCDTDAAGVPAGDICKDLSQSCRVQDLA